MLSPGIGIGSPASGIPHVRIRGTRLAWLLSSDFSTLAAPAAPGAGSRPHH